MTYKILAITALIFAVILFSAQNFSTQTIIVDKRPSQIFLQLQIHDAKGKLVTYLEPTLTFVLRPDLVDQYLSTKQHTTITKDGKRFVQFQFEENGAYSIPSVASIHNLFEPIGKKIITLEELKNKIIILGFLHEGYVVVPGDTFSAHWTVMEPLD